MTDLRDIDTGEEPLNEHDGEKLDYLLGVLTNILREQGWVTNHDLVENHDPVTDVAWSTKHIRWNVLKDIRRQAEQQGLAVVREVETDRGDNTKLEWRLKE